MIFAALELWLYRPYSEFETSQFLPIIIKTFVESSIKLGSYHYHFIEKEYTMQQMIFRRDFIITLLKITTVGTAEFSKFPFYVM